MFSANTNSRFRWVQCQLDYIANLKRHEARRKALEKLPPGLDETYTRIFEAIKIIPDNLCIAQKTLVWLMYCQRQMKLEELAIAVAIDQDDEMFHRGKQLDQNEMLIEICGSLVKMNPETRIVELGHFSVREFLSSSKLNDGKHNSYHIDTTKANSDLFRACLTYLISTPFLEVKPCESVSQLESLFADNAFLQYAAFQWPNHARLSDSNGPTETEAILEFFKSPATNAYRVWSRLWQIALMEDWMNAPKGRVERISSKATWELLKDQLEKMSCKLEPDQVPTSLFYAVTFHFPKVFRILLGKAGQDGDTMNGFYPLIAAAGNKDESMVYDLLESGADVNVQEDLLTGDKDWGVFDPNIEKLVRQLNDLFIPDEGKLGRTALTVAAKAGHIDIVKILLERGASVDIEDELGLTPLFYAAEQGHTEIVKNLLSRGAQVDRYYLILRQTALTAATRNGHTEVVELCLNAHAAIDRSRTGLPSEVNDALARQARILREVDLHTINKYEGYMARLAAKEAILTVVTLLFDNFVANRSGAEKLTALREISKKSSIEIVRILMGPATRFGFKFIYYTSQELRNVLKDVGEHNIGDLISLLSRLGK